jgi:hypothetical protein
MKLTGAKHLFKDDEHPNTPLLEEAGYRINEIRFQFTPWLSYPDLHELIVRNFNEGVDDHQEIYLNAEDLGFIIHSLKENKLPVAMDFGDSNISVNEEERQEAIKDFQSALDWMLADEIRHSVFYQASW